MAFIISLSPTYKTEVKVELPKDGGFETKTFTAEFTRVETDELSSLTQLPVKEAVRKVLVGWSGILDENKNPVPFSEENLEALMRIPQVLKAIEHYFWASIFKAKEKN